MAYVWCVKTLPKFWPSGGAQRKLNSVLFSLMTSYLCSGHELIVTLIFLLSAQVMGEGEKDQKGSEEDRMAKESLFQLLQFSCVFTSTRLRQTDSSRREFNLCGDGQSLNCIFLWCLPQGFLAYISHLYVQHVLATQEYHFRLWLIGVPQP